MKVDQGPSNAALAAATAASTSFSPAISSSNVNINVNWNITIGNQFFGNRRIYFYPLLRSTVDVLTVSKSFTFKTNLIVDEVLEN